MDKIQINNKTKVSNEKLISGAFISYYDGKDAIEITCEDAKTFFKEGDNVVLKRYVEKAYNTDKGIESKFILAFKDYAAVKSVGENIINVDAPKRTNLTMLTDSEHMGKYIIADNKLLAKITCSNKHNLFLGDFWEHNEGEIPYINARFINNLYNEEMTSGNIYLCEKDSITTGSSINGYYTNENMSEYEFYTDAVVSALTSMSISIILTTSKYCYPDPWEGKYVQWNNEGTYVTISKETGYWEVPLMLSPSDEYKGLYQEENVNNTFVKRFKEDIIPDVIDMEKLKYIPVVSNSGRGTLSDSLTFNLHFRERNMDGWYIESQSSWWNNIQGKSMINTERATKSDNLGLLNFTDGDVYNRKLKLAKSFIRLSFYTSKDPLNQSLLFYNTIFFDTGNLYGKYIKMKNTLSEEELEQWEDNLVNYSGYTIADDEKLISRMKVYDEYNSTSSSDGFNLYLFKMDSDILDEEKDYRTIYMKAEFNHSRYGKTIPLLHWYNGCNWAKDSYKLNANNYLDNLYIEVRLKYIKERGIYTYYFPNAINDTGNPNITLNLFEPRLDIQNETK